jgi:cell volume regulation protein A
MAWLMQIAMFLTLGLLVFPSRLPPVAGVGILLAVFLMFVARPLSVFICLAFSSLNLRERVFVAWVGLRGAVPIVLATYPLLAGVPKSDVIFNVVFFVVLTSVLLQGASVPAAARWLGIASPAAPRVAHPLEYTPISGASTALKELTVSEGCAADGKAIVDIGLPPKFLIVLIARDGDYLIPSGGTTVHAGDTLLALTDQQALSEAQRFICVQPA